MNLVILKFLNRLHGGKHVGHEQKPGQEFLNRLHGGKLKREKLLNFIDFLNRLHGGKQKPIYYNSI